MTEKELRTTSRIIDQTGQGVEGLRIEAWDEDLFFGDFVVSAETDVEGFFEIQFKEDYFNEIVHRKPDLFFKIHSEDEFIPKTEFELNV